MKLKINSLVAVVLILLSSFATLATNYHVTTAGNDSNDGTASDSGHAWRTIAHAVANITCDDTALVHAGIYDENWTATPKGCVSWSHPVTLKANPGDAVYLRGTGHDGIGGVIGLHTGMTTDCPPDAQPGPCWILADEYWIIEGFDFDASYSAFNQFGGAFSMFFTRHVRLLNNNFHHAANIAIGANSDNGIHCSDNSCSLNDATYYPEWERPQYDIQIIGGKIYSSGQYCRIQVDGCNGVFGNGDGHAAYLSVKNSLVQGVEIYDNPGQSPQFTNSGGRDDSNNVARDNYIHNNGAGVAFGPGHDTVAFNNVFELNGLSNDSGVTWGSGAGTYGVGMGAGSCADCKVFQNTFIGSGATVSLTSNAVLKNNLFLDGAAINEFPSSIGTVATNNVTSDSASSINSDFTLKSTATARNAGADLSSYAISGTEVDKNSGARDVSNPDAGATEYGSVASPLIATVTPVSGLQGATLDVDFVGNASAVLTSPASFSGSGITVNSTTITDDTHGSTNITIGLGAATGARTITSGNASKVNGFTVTAAGSPVISSITPNSGTQGTAPSVAVVGASTHFNDGTLAISAIPSTGVTIGTPTITDNTHVSFTLTLDVAAPAGNITLRFHTTTDGNVDATDGFAISSASSCYGSGTIGIVTGQCVFGLSASSAHTLTSFTLPSAVSSAAGHYLIATASTYKDVGATVTTNMPVSSVTGSGGETFTHCVTGATNQITQTEMWISPTMMGSTAPTVTFDYGSGTPYYANIFLSEAFGIKSSSPCDATGHATGTSTSPSASTSGSTADTGELVYAAIQTGSLSIGVSSPFSAMTVTDGYQDDYKISGATGVQTVTYSTTSAYYDAIIATLKPSTTTPMIITVSPASCAQSTSDCAIDLTGDDTTWNSGCTLAFSDSGGITITSRVNHSTTSETVHINVSPGASLSYRDITMTCGTEVASAPSGLQITYTRQARFTPFHWRF